MNSVIGYVNESVVLRSGANPLWTLTSIQWSIFMNITYIATFDNDKIRDKRWPQFMGRLKLNITSGDLTIKNVTFEDSMAYRVTLEGEHNTEHLSNTVQLNVRGENFF